MDWAFPGIALPEAMDAGIILKATLPSDLVDPLLDAYREIESNFAIRKWKASELDAGHFVEAARRIVELTLFGRATPIGKPLALFTDAELTRYEKAQGDDSYRILIPRALKSIYNIRNKRGVGHLGVVSPNEMDSTYILYSVKWVLAELVRLNSRLPASETQDAVDAIVERQIELLWKFDGRTRVLDGSLGVRERVLVLLYNNSPQLTTDLQRDAEYPTARGFDAILFSLHNELMIDHSGGTVRISPLGRVEAERIILAQRQRRA